LRQVSSTKIQKLVIIAVNAERDPSERIDASDTVPGTLQVIDSLLFGTGARATQETLGLLRDTAQAWRRELRRTDAAADANDPFADDAQIHVVNVNLRDAPDLMGRQFLLQIPTAFSLPPADVDRLMEAGRTILHASPEFKALLKSLGAQAVEP
jgi:NTE family protein